METNILKIISQYIESDKKATKEKYLIEDLGLDSLKMMQIICDIEEQYRIEIQYSNLVNILTVQDFIDLIEEKN